MIKVNRTPKPAILEQNATSWTATYLDAEKKFEQNPSPENKKLVETAEKKYNHETVKSALIEMFNGKCAYCESHIIHINYGDIEHFRPKSKFPEFCFEWDNFLLSCSICNGKSNKGNKFPLESEGDFIVNPVEENPNDFFRFEFDENTRLFLLFPKDERAKTTIDTIGLNREKLANIRTKELISILELISKIEITEMILDELSECFSDKNQYYAFIKAIIEKVKSKI
jgi:uncharacterized protein (TIGR02646 family)